VMSGRCFPSHVAPKTGMYVHCDCRHCTLQRLLANTSSRCPRVLRLRYPQEHRTPLGAVCVHLFLFASKSSTGHDSGHEMSARVCARQSEILPLCENCESGFCFHSKFTYHRLLSLPQNQRSASPWNGPTMGSFHTLQTSLGRIATGQTSRYEFFRLDATVAGRVHFDRVERLR